MSWKKKTVIEIIKNESVTIIEGRRFKNGMSLKRRSLVRIG